jgi:hypothetical protein
MCVCEGAGLMTQIRYLRRMVDGVPVVTAPAQIDITTAEQRARFSSSPRRAMESSGWQYPQIPLQILPGITGQLGSFRHCLGCVTVSKGIWLC